MPDSQKNGTASEQRSGSVKLRTSRSPVALNRIKDEYGGDLKIVSTNFAGVAEQERRLCVV